MTSQHQRVDSRIGLLAWPCEGNAIEGSQGFVVKLKIFPENSLVAHD